MSMLLMRLWDPDWTLSMKLEGKSYSGTLKDPGLSRILLLGLAVFACFPPNGAYRSVAEVAQMLNMRKRTAYRYVRTLTAVGLLERDPNQGRYRSARYQPASAVRTLAPER